MPQAQENIEQQAAEPEALPSTEAKVSIDLDDLDEPPDQQAGGEPDKKTRRAQWR